MSPLEWCQWLQQTHFATTISESEWLFPLIEGTHILTLPLSVGMIVILDLRLLGIAFSDGPGGKLVLNVMRWCKYGFAVMFLTGGLLFVTQAGKAYGNPFFRTKLIFLLLLGINAAMYQILFFPKMKEWNSASEVPSGAKFCAVFSLLVWAGVIVCGRTMAYQF